MGLGGRLGERLGGRHLVTALVLVVLLTSAGCTTQEASDETSAVRAPRLTLGLTQLIPEEGTDQALLRVTNDGDEPLLVTAVGLDWAGYGPAFAVPNDATVAPGQTLDLRTTLPEPVCDDRSPEPAAGVLDTSTGRVVVPLKDLSQDYLRRLWRTQCDARLVAEALSVDFEGGWSQEGVGDDASTASTLVLTRRSGDEPLEVRRVDGSVLYDLALDAPLRVAPGEAGGRTTVRILPGNRCDEHARGQATAPFDFELGLVVGDRRVTVPFPVSTATSNAAQTMLDRVCGRVTTAG
ncbi:hypothetical protein G7072_14925 [Nocardioides sp. HDW12B]|uniref:hypothetical protein n=1 Tax=Nocardioides sp. HDW12B TaxID=2714939 RepID=UPI00140ADB88|nr:hypothetical protein [Nocardioides sp. HDW12B]QIK67464.1 hypothetical protein G7072_14925 [Nocardioides sp. HDW12B]